MHYINDNSTKYEATHELNLADALYEENIAARKEIAKLENKIKNIIHAPSSADIIYTSGATECIATCIHWVKTINPFGMVIGSDFDHSAVAENCKAYNIPYKQIDINNIDNIELDDKCAALFLTHVSGKTGEIMDVGKIVKTLRKNYDYLQDDIPFSKYNKKLLQYKPMVFVDATQSMLRTKIDMTKWDVDGVFWSNHKLGGHMRSGVLVIRQQLDKPFVPLIAGAQNNGLRGGSISASVILQDKNIYDYKDDVHKRDKEWTAAYQYLTSQHIKVYKPKQPHLFNTLLIDVGNKCPFALLATLAKKHIYISPKSACVVEKQINNNKTMLNSSNENHWEELAQLEDDIEYLYSHPQQNTTIVKQHGANKHNDFDNALRLSFNNGDQLNDYILDTIVKTINEAESD